MLKVEKLYYLTKILYKVCNYVNCIEDNLLIFDNISFAVSWSDPLYILTHSKVILREAINRDASFLEKNHIMDYSLLVGQNSQDKQLVLGIIGKLCE